MSSKRYSKKIIFFSSSNNDYLLRERNNGEKKLRSEYGEQHDMAAVATIRLYY